jgi:Domain of unknown function (DUF5655)/Domain of unknown function (DUF4287)
MTDIDAALRSQIRNIEATYGRSVADWIGVIDAAGLTKHTDVVAMLKRDHGLAHGAAHRLSLLARNRAEQLIPPIDPADALYVGAKAKVRPLHDALIAEVGKLGPFETAAKRNYLSLRRRKQFAMVQPSTTGRLDLGLILSAGTACSERLEPAGSFNALFTHRVRLSHTADIDQDVTAWLAAAYSGAG